MGDYSELKRAAEAIEPGTFRTPEAWEEDRRYSDEEIRQIEFMALATPETVLALIAENEQSQRGNVILGDLVAKVVAERDQLKAKNKALRKGLAECTASLEGEMLQKYHGQKPEDMHPVTRRNHDRDMAELDGYRAAMSKEAGNV